jgi:hypothetical protein
MKSVGANGDTPVSPAKTQLKRLADKLTEEDAAIVLSLARKLARRSRPEDEDAADVRALRKALAEPGEIPYEEYRRARGR